MEEEKVNFETAKLAKEKGFNVSTLDSFYLNGETVMEISVEDYPFAPFNWNSNTEFDFARPTQSLLQKWLREVHNIETLVRPFINEKTHEKHYRAFTIWFDGKMYHDNVYFSHATWEGALEIILQQSLNIIPNK